MAAKSYGFLTLKSGLWKCVFLRSVLPKMLEVGHLEHAIGLAQVTQVLPKVL